MESIWIVTPKKRDTDFKLTRYILCFLFVTWIEQAICRDESLLDCSSSKRPRWELLRYFFGIYGVKKNKATPTKQDLGSSFQFFHRFLPAPLSIWYLNAPSPKLMVNSLCETCLKKIIVVAFIILDWLIVLMNTATMISKPFVCKIYTPSHASIRALSRKLNDDRADDHWYSFAWIPFLMDQFFYQFPTFSEK